MIRLIPLATAPLLLAVAACGERDGQGVGPNELVQTNSGNVVLNDSHANQLVESSNEQPHNLVAPGGQ